MVNLDRCEAEGHTAAGTGLVSIEVNDCQGNCENNQESCCQSYQESKSKILRLRTLLRLETQFTLWELNIAEA